VSRLDEGLIRLNADLSALRLRWALIGGLAVSFRSAARTTKDLDVVIAVASDNELDAVVRSFHFRGYHDHPENPFLWQKDQNRIATVRLLAPGEERPSRIEVDLFFASSGVETEIVAAAETLAILPGVYVPVARTGHLMALKVLAGRDKDRADFRSLLEHADPGEIQRARETLALISERGFHRGKDLFADFEKLMEPEG
jgi:predicted nucleotidyltransferase